MSSLSHIHAVGLFGLGAFGQFLARHLAPHVEVVAHDPRAPEIAGLHTNLRRASLHEAARCPLVILAVPVDAMTSLCREIFLHLRPGTIVTDVGSVKLAPCRVMCSHLPDHVDLVGTHPLFGPQSAASGIAGHKIALCNIRGHSHLAVAAFLRGRLGLRVIQTSAEEHDREVATVQGLTHLIARTLADMGPLPARMTTTSFDLLVQASQMVQGDPPGVFAAIAEANPFAAAVREEFLRKAAGLVMPSGP